MDISKHFKGGKPVGWKKYIMGRNFHLCTGTTVADYQFAVRFAVALTARSELLQLADGQWTDAVIEECRELARGMKSPVPQAPMTHEDSAAPLPESSPSPPATQPASPMLYATMELFKESEQQRGASGLITDDHAKDACHLIERSKRGISDRPMGSLTLADLKGWTGYWAARPPSRAKATKGRPISVETVRMVVGVARRFLDWADAEGHWVAVRRWEDAFKGITKNKLMTGPEKKKQAMGYPHFTVRECQMLWRKCGLDQTKIFMGLGLWCGHTQAELATIMLDDFKERNGEMHLDRCRNKTGVYGRWWIPPELAQWVRKELAYTREHYADREPLAFRTRCGRPLIHPTKKSRSDSVGLQWKHLMEECHFCGVRKLSFKFLRKTLSQEVRDRLGLEFAKIFTAQKIQDVQDQNYTKGNFEKLEKIIKREIYPTWKKMFEKFNVLALTKSLQQQLRKAA